MRTRPPSTANVVLVTVVLTLLAIGLVCCGMNVRTWAFLSGLLGLS